MSAAILALEALKQEPVAWMHEGEGRVDCIHKSVKELWIKAGHPHGFYREKVPCKVEHYTIPLYATPQQPAPNGWVLVPIEPTPEMIGAMAVEEASGSINGVRTIGMSGAELAYESMLQAAPKASS